MADLEQASKLVSYSLLASSDQRASKALGYTLLASGDQRASKALGYSLLASGEQRASKAVGYVVLSGQPATPPVTGSATFELTLSVALPVPCSVSYVTVDGTAQAGIDYEAASGTATFAPGQTSTSIVVPILGNLSATTLKQFSVALSGPASCLLGASTATATIST